MKIPEKAQRHPRLIAELNRIASPPRRHGRVRPRPRHASARSSTPSASASTILDLFEDVCGARLTYSYITIGGVHDDLPDGLDRPLPEVPRLLQAAHPRIPRAADEQPHLRQAHRRHRRAVEGDGPELRLHRPDAARLARPHEGRPGLGPAQDRAVLRLRDSTTSTCRCRRSTTPRRARSSATAGTASTSGCSRWWRAIKIVRAGDRQVRRAARRGREGEGRVRGAEADADADEAKKRRREARRANEDEVLAPRRAAAAPAAGECYVETECPRGQMGFHVVGRPARRTCRCGCGRGRAASAT